MAGLTTCPDCGAQVSTSAAACPKCGRNLRSMDPAAVVGRFGLIPFLALLGLIFVLMWRAGVR